MKDKFVLKLLIIFILMFTVSFFVLDFKFRLENRDIKDKNSNSNIPENYKDETKGKAESKNFKDKENNVKSNENKAQLKKEQAKNNTTRLDNSTESTYSTHQDTPARPSNLANPINNNLSDSEIIQNEINEEKDISNKDIYNYKDLKIAIRGAVRDFKQELSLDVYNVNKDDYVKVVREVFNEYAELDFGFSDSLCTFTTYGNGKTSLKYTLNYKTQRDILIVQRDKVNKKVKDIIDNNINKNMSKVQKELIFHDYLVNNAEYNTYYINKGIVHPTDYTAYGILIDKKGVCEGYAKAFSLLCKSADINCIVVKGNARGPHAWNMIKLDDDRWYNVDVTWDDPIVANKSVPLVKTNHTYFNIATAEINKTHRIGRIYPTANGVKYLRDNIDIKEYDAQGNLFTKVSSLNELKGVVKAKLLKKNLTITCNLKGFTLEQQSIINVIKNVANENSIRIVGMNLTTNGTPIMYFKVSIKY